jgi:hypothetical protein
VIKNLASLRVSAAHNRRDTGTAASAIIHSAVFPKNSVRGVEATIRFSSVSQRGRCGISFSKASTDASLSAWANLPEERNQTVAKRNCATPISAADADVDSK